MMAHMQALRSGWAAVLLALALSGCSSAVDHIPSSLGGLPDGVPARPASPPAYPAVHDMPPPRQDSALSEAENKRLRQDLNVTREKAKTSAPLLDEAGTAGGARNP